MMSFSCINRWITAWPTLSYWQAGSITHSIFIHHCTFLNFTSRLVRGERADNKIEAQRSGSVEFKPDTPWFWVNALSYCTTLRALLSRSKCFLINRKFDCVIFSVEYCTRSMVALGKLFRILESMGLGQMFREKLK